LSRAESAAGAVTAADPSDPIQVMLAWGSKSVAPPGPIGPAVFDFSGDPPQRRRGASCLATTSDEWRRPRLPWR
jgi:hypothetical protein